MTTIEMRQITIVRRPVGTVVAWCPNCLKDVELVMAEQIALIARVSVGDIYQQITADEIHIVETDKGALICLESLLNNGSLQISLLRKMGEAL